MKVSGSLYTRWPCCFFLMHSGPACHGQRAYGGGSGVRPAEGRRWGAGGWAVVDGSSPAIP